MDTITTIMNSLLKMSVYMKECRKVFACSNKLVLHKLGIIRKWKMFSSNSINDTYKVYKSTPFQEWSKINYYLQVGIWLTVLVSLKSKLPKFKLLVWLIPQMVVEVTVISINHKSNVQQERIWTKNLKNLKFQEQSLIYVNLKAKIHVRYLLQEVINNKNWKERADGDW